MAFKQDDPLLDRFRAQYAEYRATHPRMQLYALLDVASVSANRQRLLSDTIGAMPRIPLYGSTGLDDLAATGPFLIVCPAPEGDEPLRAYRSLLRLGRDDGRFVSWLWATHEVEPLIEHLQTLLHARLGTAGEDAWFFFHQPAYLPVLHRTLPEGTRRYLFGPCLAWWCLDYRSELVELAGENLPIPDAWEALPVPDEVVDALHRAGAPVQVRAWLQRVRPDVFDDRDYPNDQLQQVAPLVEQAFGYGVTEKTDQGVYVAAGLLYGPQYDDHPALQAALTQFRNGKTALIDAYMALGDDVWREVAATSRQRAAEAAAEAHQAKLREYGHATLRVKIINDTPIRKRTIEIESTRGHFSTSASLGDIDPHGFEPTERVIAAARMPIPGTRVTVKWIGPMGENSDDAMVAGELPRVEGEGLAIVKFARNWRVYVSMYAVEPKPEARLW
ncbi:DUF4123 domain-containing protein [Paraburkholderia phenoliruptrix]|uniref:DUF4123 domain-containing protein n=2 Tax=Paraburkholderia phenoliruptrix TaxID=252970 RepID=A0A6J5K3L9_9BURK|nr:DUF4123 domain-containing protein [Paraburkholderia phenoliruptrix]MDR6421783.1 hypothetical protein [Paraburkholderia phenoliruptrix]CAB4048198.1 hypothetical protein LMG9964_01832 [Paraburkholderia phenoliruptrix]